LEFATTGGLQNLQCWNTEGIFHLIQFIPRPEAEPFKRWLARIAAQPLQSHAIVRGSTDIGIHFQRIILTVKMESGDIK
jgi:hypothetical protein